MSENMVTILEDIQAKIRDGKFEFSQHAVDRSILRGVSVNELREASQSGEIIEDYPSDKYGPSCLIFGRTLNNRPFNFNALIPRGHCLNSLNSTNHGSTNGSTSGRGEANHGQCNLE